MYLEPSQTSMMKLFAKVVNRFFLQKMSIIRAQRGPPQTSKIVSFATIVNGSLAKAGKYFVYERKEIMSFSRLSGKTTGKLFSCEQPLR